MSISAPPRRFLSLATSLIPQAQSRSHVLPVLTTCSYAPPYPQRRYISLNPFGRRSPQLDPDSVKKLRPVIKPAEPPAPKQGDLAPTSIFEQEEPSTPETQQVPSTPSREPSPPSNAYPGRDPKSMAAALDPRPRARQRWLRKMVIRDVRSRGRLNKTEKILRTERSHLTKSPWIKTSIKKLYPLARQIAGKPVTEAMVQMRFSKKKAAKEVLKHLEYARDQAIVQRGMGLGSAGKEKDEDGKELVVEDKKGKKRVVKDLSDIYVDEAWVGRGPYGKELEYRARSKGNMLRLPYTSISVVLKEEATRVRLQEERELKRQRKKVWVPLPDRPVTAQRQYPLW